MEYSTEKNELTTKDFLISLFISILYLPLIILGQIIGDAFRDYIDIRLRDSFVQELIYNLLPTLIPCVICGLVAGIIVVKYSSSKKFVSLIIPAIFTFPVVIYTFLSLASNYSSYRPLLYGGDVEFLAFKLLFIIPIFKTFGYISGYLAYWFILFVNDPNDSKIDKDFGLVSTDSVLTKENTKDTSDHENNKKIMIPDLGSDVSFATIKQWLKEPGDTVVEEESVVVIETDKVTIEIHAPSRGVIDEVYYPKGSKVTVGDIICKLR
jgi:hypothetical protein